MIIYIYFDQIVYNKEQLASINHSPTNVSTNYSYIFRKHYSIEIEEYTQNYLTNLNTIIEQELLNIESQKQTLYGQIQR